MEKGHNPSARDLRQQTWIFLFGKGVSRAHGRCCTSLIAYLVLDDVGIQMLFRRIVGRMSSTQHDAWRAAECRRNEGLGLNIHMLLQLSIIEARNEETLSGETEELLTNDGREDAPSREVHACTPRRRN